MGSAVSGTSDGPGVPGVRGDGGTDNDGVQGFSKHPDRTGVVGTGTLGVGVLGQSNDNDGVRGFTKHKDRTGVVGTGTLGVGVLGQSDDNDGVRGFTKHKDRTGVVGTNTGAGNGLLGQSANGIGLVASGGRLAAFFKGDVEVTGDIRLVNGDGAELFDTGGDTLIAPGSVVVVDDDGVIQPAASDYDTRVVGIVSGAGAYRPGLLLDNRPGDAERLPVAVFGKVYCQVDATIEPISTGDLLCSSRTEGHAMRAADSAKAFGAVIGKALAPITGGRGLIPVLVALQ